MIPGAVRPLDSEEASGGIGSQELTCIVSPTNRSRIVPSLKGFRSSIQQSPNPDQLFLGIRIGLGFSSHGIRGAFNQLRCHLLGTHLPEGIGSPKGERKGDLPLAPFQSRPSIRMKSPGPIKSLEHGLRIDNGSDSTRRVQAQGILVHGIPEAGQSHHREEALGSRGVDLGPKVGPVRLTQLPGIPPRFDLDHAFESQPVVGEEDEER